MCTASWSKRERALHLFFNRDELRSREPALPPTVGVTNGVRWIAPADGKAGGTWIAATERGAALALLNRSEGLRPDLTTSRGELIPRLAGADDPESLTAGLAAAPLESYAPFRLLALWRRLQLGAVADWDGRRMEIEDVEADLGLLCSSGLGDRRAQRARTAIWDRLRRASDSWEAAEHRRFHRDHSPAPSAWSVCVHRPEAATVSFTEVELGEEAVTLRYHDAPPCRPTRPATVRLATVAVDPDR